MKRWLAHISVVAVLALLAVLLPQVALSPLGLLSQVAFASDNGTSSGNFTVGQVAPYFDYSGNNTSTVLDVYSVGGVAQGSLTPQVEYFVKVTVTDNNTLADLSTVKVVLKYFAAGTTPSGSPENDATDNSTEAIYYWTPEGSFQNYIASTTWTMESVDCSAPTLTANSGNFTFAFKPAKVATSSIGGAAANAGWGLYAYTIDSGSNSDSAWYCDGSSMVKKAMNDYLEITVATDNQTVSWGSVTPGTGFADNVNEIGPITLTHISNGDYKTQVMSSIQWNGTSNNATFDIGGTTANAKEFSLKAYYTDTFSIAVQVNLTGSDDINNSTGVLTPDDPGGTATTTNTLWLRLASVFPVDTYTGTITYIIASR